MSRVNYWLSPPQNDGRHFDNDAAKTLQYVGGEIENVIKLLESVGLGPEPGLSQESITKVISGIAGIQAAIATCTGSAAPYDTLHRSVCENNEVFLRHLRITILQSLTDSKLDVNKLCDLMNMSRRNLFRRIKSTTGLSPGELINQIRLRTARELLQDSGLRIYEIAEQVGFKSRIVFTRNFTRLYGTSPTEFLKDHNHKLIKQNLLP